SPDDCQVIVVTFPTAWRRGAGVAWRHSQVEIVMDTVPVSASSPSASPHSARPRSGRFDADAPLARLHNAYKRYGKVIALDGIDLELRAGELLALLGPNGAGKSTAIGLLLGLIRADQGRVELFGRDPQQLAARRQVGVMLQNAELPPTLRVGELIRLTS